MIKTMRKWFPEAGEYSAWLEQTRKDVTSGGYKIFKEESGPTFTGGEWVLFSIQRGELNA